MEWHINAGSTQANKGAQHLLPVGRHMAGKCFILNGLWWALQDSNLRLPPCEGGTLPLS